jgi:hemolysin-activating ACP:hemolysin acyltransferase
MDLGANRFSPSILARISIVIHQFPHLTHFAFAPASDAGVATPPVLSPEEAQRRAAYSHRISAAFGEIVSVLMRAPAYRQLTLAGVEELVVPAVITGQFFLAEAHSKENGFTSPVGVVLWASVSPEVDYRLSTTLDQPFRLGANEWKSGDILWLVDAIGDQRIVGGMLKHLQSTPWKGRNVKLRMKNPQGQTEVKTLAVN